MRYAPTPVRLIHGWDGDFFASSLPWRAYAIRPYTYSLNHWAGRLFLCMFAHVEGVCDTPLQFLSQSLGGTATSLRVRSHGGSM